jgi:hypothetical protein
MSDVESDGPERLVKSVERVRDCPGLLDCGSSSVSTSRP